MKVFLTVLLMALCIGSRECSALDAATLTDYTRQVASQICKGNTSWLRCYGIDPLNCENKSETIIHGCLRTYVFSRTTPVKSEAEVQTVSQQVYGCIRTSFSEKFDVQKKDSPECKDLE